jgi:hypothetical protein
MTGMVMGCSRGSLGGYGILLTGAVAASAGGWGGAPFFNGRMSLSRKRCPQAVELIVMYRSPPE